MNTMRRLLIANRGEIACRIMRSCRRLGIETVAVFSAADRNQPFVAMADRACLLGPAPAAESYLHIQRLLDIGRQQQVDAVHPGYGFLAENSLFARRCVEAGFTFVGPPARCMEQMGSKDRARAIAEQAGLPVVPGYHGSAQDDQCLLTEAQRLGFPLLLKAANGGGGKGMRPVYSAAEFLPALALVRQEAVAAFGAAGVVIEKLLRRPRHIEVQIAGDQHGNRLHLFERECSVQRRYQKLIEECPAAYLTDTQRQQLYRDALRLAVAIDYQSLGTMEFILDQETGQHYFLEMNTRLQVEHTVTEQVTGLDLIELQLRIAMGEPLDIRQSDLQLQGWAMEARINAEDAGNNFMPCIGTIELYREPCGVRVDSGVARGSAVTPWYDSMLAKVVASGADRGQALAALRRALGEYAIGGVTTNLPFLRDFLARPAFSTTPLHTGLIDEQFPSGWQAAEPPLSAVIGAAVWRIQSLEGPARPSPSPSIEPSQSQSPWRTLGNWRLLHRAGWPGSTRVLLSSGEWNWELQVEGSGPSLGVSYRETRQQVEIQSFTDQAVSLMIGDQVFAFQLLSEGAHLVLTGSAGSWPFRAVPGYPAVAAGNQAPSAETTVTAPMPGLISALPVAAGDAVRKGQVVAVMEAMKLVHSLVAPSSGLAKLLVAVGDTVTGGQLLVEIEPA